MRDGPQRRKGSAAARAAFLERQSKHSAVEARRNISQLQKQILRDGRSADDVEFWGAQGREGFRTYLEKKHGSIVNGWRALDRDKNGRLSFYEFCNNCRAMGFHGNFKKLWKQLDENGNGFVSIMEIDPEVGRYVGTYKLALMKKYGDMLTAWKKGIDVNGSGRIEEREIAASLERLGITDLEPKTLFRMLSTNKKLGLTLQEFDPDSYNRFVSGDFKGLTMKANKEFLEDVVDGPEDMPQDPEEKKGGVLEWRRQLMEKDRKEHFAELDRIKQVKCGVHDAEGFKKVLVQRCGSLLQAWRRALDLDGNGKITFGEFVVALGRLGLHGDIKGLWKQLDVKGKGWLVFADLDPEIDAQIAELKEKLEKTYGNVLLAWIKAFDVKGNGLVPEQQFVKGCHIAGFSGDPKVLFNTLRPNKERAFLTIRDYDNRAYLALSRGDFKMLSEQDNPAYGGKKPLELSFDERQEAGQFYQIRRSWEAAQRDEFAKACRVEIQERRIDTPEEFEDLCVRKFGSLTAAWRMCLDADGNGKLTFNEFCQGLRRLGFAGDLKAMWKHYDCDRSGHISLQEIDPKGFEELNSFLSLMTDKYGDLDSAWKWGFGKDPHGSIDLQELREGCSNLGYEGDVDQLFKNLSPMPGRQLLTIWDIDPECTRKRQRGQAVGGGATAPPSTKTSVMSSGGGNPNNPGDVAFSPRRQLKNVLRTAFGSTVIAWRQELDQHMQGSVTFGKFMIVMEHCNFTGNVKKLWEQLTEGRAGATFKDIDPEAFKGLAVLREQLVGKYGSLVQAWDQCIDVDLVGRVDESEFVAALEAGIGAPQKTAKKYFSLLRSRPGQRSLACEDLQALLITVPQDQYAAVWSSGSGGAAAASSSPHDEGGGEASAAAPAASTAEGFSNSNSGGGGGGPTSPVALKVEPDVISPRQFAENITTAHHEKDIIIRSVDRFKQMLVVKYGSLFSAWRKALDVDQNGVLTQADFAKACQFLGVKAVQSLWSQMDVQMAGQISLKELDSEVAQLFAELDKLLVEKFPSRVEGWKRTFDPENKLRCDLPDFKSGCTKLGFHGQGKGSAERLFKLLRPEAGRPYLAYEDLWVNKDPNCFGHGSSGGHS